MAKGTFKVVVAAEDGSKTYEELRILSVTKDITDFDSGVKKIISDSGPLRKTRETFLTENIVLSDGQLGIELDTGKITLGNGTNIEGFPKLDISVIVIAPLLATIKFETFIISSIL